MGKTALVDINDGAPFILISFNLLTEDVPCGGVCLWMLKCFFYK
jgi:hypothetical protein